MSNEVIIFNGLSLPFTVVDRAIGSAVQSKSSLTGLFLSARKTKNNDAKTSSSLASVKDHRKHEEQDVENTAIIESYMTMLKDKVVKAHVEVKTALIESLGEKTIMDCLIDGEIIFTQRDNSVAECQLTSQLIYNLNLRLQLSAIVDITIR